MRMHNRGFTILEISIVMLIIALIVAAIFAGIAMIRNAEMLSAMANVKSYLQAMETFKDKYKDLPGDFPGAEALWGSDVGCPGTAYTPTQHTATCNGNGNNHIGDHFSDGGVSDYETFRAWQHLANASMVTNTFSGISGPGSSNEALRAINVPAAPMDGGAYSVFYFQPQNFAAEANYFAAEYGHIIILGAFMAGDFTKGPLLKPEYALAIDTKIDDGLPAFGEVMTTKSAVTPHCTTSDTPAVSRYNTAFKDTACNLIFITGF